MSLFIDVVTYSGWVGSLISTAYIGVQHVQSRQDKRQMEHLTSLLTRLSAPEQEAPAQPVLPMPVGTARANLPAPATVDERVRAALIRTAAAKQSVRVAMRQLRDVARSPEDVLAASVELQRRGLLTVTEPVGLDSVLELKV